MAYIRRKPGAANTGPSELDHAGQLISPEINSQASNTQDRLTAYFVDRRLSVHPIRRPTRRLLRLAFEGFRP